MKKSFSTTTIVFATLLGMAAPSLWASPIGHLTAGRRYYVAARDLHQWSAGGYVKSGSRDTRQGDYDFTKAVMFLGHDFTPWVTTFVKAGMNNTTISAMVPDDDDYSLEIGFGMRFNLLHHEIMDPTLLEDRLFVNASWEYSTTQASRGSSTQDFHELQASLTLSIVNDILGSKLYLPHSIGLFFGPTFSLVSTSGATTRDELGFIVGLEVFHSNRLSLHAALEQIGTDSSSVLVGLHLCL